MTIDEFLFLLLGGVIGMFAGIVLMASLKKSGEGK